MRTQRHFVRFLFLGTVEIPSCVLPLPRSVAHRSSLACYSGPAAPVPLSSCACLLRAPSHRSADAAAERAPLLTVLSHRRGRGNTVERESKAPHRVEHPPNQSPGASAVDRCGVCRMSAAVRGERRRSRRPGIGHTIPRGSTWSDATTAQGGGARDHHQRTMS